MPSVAKNPTSVVFLVLSVCVYLAISFIFINRTSFLVDEGDHSKTISEIATSQVNEETFSRNAQLPGYYFLMSIFYYLGINSLSGLRFVQLIISLLCIFVFMWSLKTRGQKEKYIKTWQLLTFPYLSIFFVLVYTDVLSLLLVLFCFALMRRKHFFLSAITGLLSILVRQNNVICLLYFCLYHFLENYGFNIKFQKYIFYIKDVFWFVLPLGFTAIFLYINKGAALANSYASPLSFHVENIFFFLFSVTLLFLPQVIFNLKKIIFLVIKKPWLILFLVGLGVVYFTWFKADNFFNSQHYNYHLRNLLLNTMKLSLLLNLLFLVTALVGFLYLLTIKLETQFLLLFFGFSIVFLGTSWLIEERYLIIPFVFLLLFKPVENRKIELIQVVYFILINSFLFWGAISGGFFL